MRAVIHRPHFFIADSRSFLWVEDDFNLSWVFGLISLNHPCIPLLSACIRNMCYVLNLLKGTILLVSIMTVKRKLWLIPIEISQINRETIFPRKNGVFLAFQVYRQGRPRLRRIF